VNRRFASLDDDTAVLTTSAPKLPTRTPTEKTAAPVKEIKKTDLSKKRERLELDLRTAMGKDADEWIDKCIITAIEAHLAKLKVAPSAEQITAAAAMIASLTEAA
jgi:hypothetical protein